MESRVHYPSQRTCPPDVLRGVRLVDPDAELLYSHDGQWILGVVRFSWPAYQQACQTLQQLEQSVTLLPSHGSDAEKQDELERRGRSNHLKRAFNRLALQGYRHIAVYRQNDPDSRIVQDFQYRDFELRIFADFGLDLVLAQALDTEDQHTLARINKLRDAIRTHGTATYRYLAGQRHITTIGSKGAAA